MSRRSRLFRPNRTGGPDAQSEYQDPYDFAAARYRITQGDMYEQQARAEIDRGNRMPLPYQSPSALAGMPSASGVDPRQAANYMNLHARHAVNAAPNVAGRRQTLEGGFGAPPDRVNPDQWFDARKRFGYGEAQSRGPGYSDRWDSQQGEERTAGRLESPTTFDQQVFRERSYLHIRAGGEAVVPGEGTYNGNAILRVTVGNFKNGGAESRQFWLGGGLVACFDLRGWENIRFELIELLDGTFVEFAWTDRGLQGPDRSLQYPDVYQTSLLTVPVPEGAYALTIDDPGAPVNLFWTGRRLGNIPWTFQEQVNTAASGASTYFGQLIPVRAPTIRMDANVDVLWWLRPI